MVQGIVVPSDERAPVEVCEFRTLQDYQTAVDGWIEPIDIPLLGITVYVNEGARRRRLELNSRATLLWWFFTPSARLQVMLMGDVVIAGCLEDEYSAGDVPDDITRKLTDDAEYAIQMRPIGGAIWFETRSSFKSYFDALLWGMLIAERWRSTDEVRVVRVHSTDR